MVRTVLHYFSVAHYSFKLSIQKQLEYPINLVTWFLIIPLQAFGGILLLRIIILRFQPLAGWTFGEIAFIYALGYLTQGIQVSLFLQTWFIGHFIIHGEFDRILVRPLNTFFLFAFRNVHFNGILDLIPGMIIFIYSSQLIGFVWSFTNIIKLLFVLTGGALIRTALFMFVGTFSFWFKTRRPASFILQEILVQFTHYPLNIYPYFIQVIFTFFIPLAFISFYPAVGFFNKNKPLIFPFDFSLITLILGGVLFGLAVRFFKTGLKYYESAGN
ncbi:ABC transporter permease [Spirochaetota bacterium]